MQAIEDAALLRVMEVKTGIAEVKTFMQENKIPQTEVVQFLNAHYDYDGTTTAQAFNPNPSPNPNPNSSPTLIIMQIAGGSGKISESGPSCNDSS